MSCDKETVLPKHILNAALVYRILQEKLCVETNSHQSTKMAVFATEPYNRWSWSAIFDLTAKKQICETRDARFAEDF